MNTFGKISLAVVAITLSGCSDHHTSPSSPAAEKNTSISTPSQSNTTAVPVYNNESAGYTTIPAIQDAANTPALYLPERESAAS